MMDVDSNPVPLRGDVGWSAEEPRTPLPHPYFRYPLLPPLFRLTPVFGLRVRSLVFLCITGTKYGTETSSIGWSN